MDRRDLPDDRRRATRRPAAGKVLWQGPMEAEEHVGWFCDRSRTGIAFVTSRGIEPFIGERLVIRGPRGEARSCQVVRVTPYGGGLSLVATRRDDRDPEQETRFVPRTHG
jgi:hypothetical protein